MQNSLDPDLPLRVKTVFLSDIHLGTRFCKDEFLLDFLDRIDPEQLILVGDIIDMWALHSGWYWKENHSTVIRRFLDFARDGKRVVYIPGNHDEGFRDYSDLRFGDIEIRERIVYRTAGGEQLMVIHGDQYDIFMQRSYRILARAGDFLFHAIQFLSRWNQKLRQWLGMEYWSLAGYLKVRTKSMVKIIGRFEEALTMAAEMEGFDGVICGHIHHAEISRINNLVYMNTGDWVDSCTALVEDFQGAFHIIHWINVVEGRLESLIPLIESSQVETAEV